MFDMLPSALPQRDVISLVPVEWAPCHREGRRRVWGTPVSFGRCLLAQTKAHECLSKRRDEEGKPGELLLQVAAGSLR